MCSTPFARDSNRRPPRTRSGLPTVLPGLYWLHKVRPAAGHCGDPIAVILSCPECTVRYRFDESKIPDRGVPVRCGRCRFVFRVSPPEIGSRPSGSPKGAAAPSPTRMRTSAAEPQGRPRQGSFAAKGAAVSDASSEAGETAARAPGLTSKTPVAGRASKPTAQPGSASPAAMSTSTIPPGQPPQASQGGTVVPVSVVSPLSESMEKDVRRLTRIILSDIVIYSPERADKAIREGKFPEVYRAEIEEGRKMIRTRFPGSEAAVESYDRSLQDLLDVRRKELQEAASAL